MSIAYKYVNYFCLLVCEYIILKKCKSTYSSKEHYAYPWKWKHVSENCKYK